MSRCADRQIGMPLVSCGRPPLERPGEAALRSVLLLDAAYRSARSGKPEVVETAPATN